jgi:RimJ/RimL family protein N-acetyltransferase
LENNHEAILTDGFLISYSFYEMEIDVSKLQGHFVYLELLQLSHIPQLKILAKDERLWEYTKTILINDTYGEQIDKYLATALDPNGIGLQRSFVIHDAVTKEIIGMSRFYRIEPSQKRLDIGYTWYSPAYWGKIHNKECKLFLLQYVFETVGFQRVEFEVAHQNIRSQKAVEKIGGIKEGVLRKHGLRGDGSIRHTVIFSIIDDEWPSVKQHLLKLITTEKNR